MNIIDRISKIHVWVGLTQQSEKEFLQYFDLDYSTEGNFDTLDYKICGFCKDIGEKWYEEEFLVFEPFYKNGISIEGMLKQSDVAPCDTEMLRRKCEDLGITHANAIFSYSDAEIVVPKPYKESYNGLKYLGLFELA